MILYDAKHPQGLDLGPAKYSKDDPYENKETVNDKQNLERSSRNLWRQSTAG